MSSWKNHERRTAKSLGGERHVRGNFSESAPDVDHDTFSVECKHRKKIPKYFWDWLEQARSYDPMGTKLPLVVYHGKYEHDSVVIIGLKDFEQWYGKIKK